MNCTIPRIGDSNYTENRVELQVHISWRA